MSFFIHGLEKHAEKKKKPYKAEGAIGGLGAGVGALAATAPTPLLNRVIFGGKSNPERAQKYFDAATKRHGLNVDWRKDVKAHKSMWHPGAQLINGGHGSIHTPGDIPISILAHELGHARHLGRKGKAGLVASLLARQVGPLAGIAAGGAVSGSDNEKLRKAAPYIAAAGSLPTLYQEGRASYHAYHDIKNILGKAHARKSLGRLIPAFGTYATLPIGAGVGMHLAQKWQERRAKKLERK